MFLASGWIVLIYFLVKLGINWFLELAEVPPDTLLLSLHFLFFFFILISNDFLDLFQFTNVLQLNFIFIHFWWGTVIGIDGSLSTIEDTISRISDGAAHLALDQVQVLVEKIRIDVCNILFQHWSSSCYSLLQGAGQRRQSILSSFLDFLIQ